MSSYFWLPLPSFMGPGHSLQPDCGGRYILCQLLTVQLWMPPPGGCVVCSLYSSWSTPDHSPALAFTPLRPCSLCFFSSALLSNSSFTSFTDDLPCTYPLFSLPFFFSLTKSSYHSLSIILKHRASGYLTTLLRLYCSWSSVLVSCQIQKYCAQRQEPGL